jgi:hypothetical protein
LLVAELDRWRVVPGQVLVVLPQLLEEILEILVDGQEVALQEWVEELLIVDWAEGWLGLVGR